jgi:nucleoid-associated protein YgaU
VKKKRVDISDIEMHLINIIRESDHLEMRHYPMLYEACIRKTKKKSIWKKMFRFLFVLLPVFFSSCCLLSPCPVYETSYIVSPGDTLEEISIKFYGSELQMRLIMEANFLKQRGRLEAGRKLIIPYKGSR